MSPMIVLRALLALVALALAQGSEARTARPPVAIAITPSAAGTDSLAPVRLRAVRIDSEIVGVLAETRVTLTFFNPNPRQLEGELQFPLVEGQTVVGFAMEVGGKLRDAVPVEKQKAQAVFEAIEREQIDPAVLSATQGNNYKARVYPIAPRADKVVVVRYAESLVGDRARRQLRIPLDYGALDEFSMRVVVRDAPSAPVVSAPFADRLRFVADGRDQIGAMEQKNFKPSAPLVIALRDAARPRVYTQRFDDKTYFFAEAPVPTPREAMRPAPRVLGLLWDSSGSAATHDHARIFAALAQFFAGFDRLEVRLVRFRDRAEAPRVFTVERGNWTRLRNELEATVYDGGTSYSGIGEDPRVDEHVLVGDGLANFGEERFPTLRAPIHVLHAATRADSQALRRIAEKSGGAYVDLGVTDPAGAARALRRASTHVTQVRGDGAHSLVTATDRLRDGIVTVAGVVSRLPARIEIVTGEKRLERVTLQVNDQANEGSRSSLVAPLWARMRIAELEAERGDRAEILRIGKTFGLATRETSLLILETARDYARYEIEPPSELLAEYDRERKAMHVAAAADRRSHLEKVLAQLDEKVKWWRREFPKDAKPAAVAEGRANRGELEDRLSVARQAARPSAPAPAAAPARMESEANRMAAPTERMAKRADTATSDAIRIRLQPWRSDAPYLARLATAPREALYRIYLEEREHHGRSSAFFLDMADRLLDAGLADLGIRVLSNLAEMDLENRHLLRILGYRLLQAREPALAVPILRKVLALAPEEPQSHRDLGLAHAANGRLQDAVEALHEVVVRPWHGRFPGIELIALAEMNAVIAQGAGAVRTDAIDRRLLVNLPLDLRVVLTWDSDNTDIDLWVTDPNGERAFYGNRLTYAGGRMSDDFTGGYGPEEFSLRNAKPGKYRVEANFYGHRQQVVAGATTLQVKLATHFGTAKQAEQLVTLRLAGASQTVFVGEFEVGEKGREDARRE